MQKTIISFFIKLTKAPVSHGWSLIIIIIKITNVFTLNSSDVY